MSKFRVIVLILLAVNLNAFASAKPKKPKMKVIVVNAEAQVVEGATITVYGDFKSYENETDPIISGTTNKKGFFLFKNLDEKKYYLLIKKGDANNHQTTNETDVLKLKGKNRFEIEINE